MTADVVIVGAGIVGGACARECALAGMRTLVIEAAFPACGATAAGMGHVVVMDDSEPQFALTRLSQQLWDQLAPQLPAEAEYQPCGTLWVAADEEELAEVRRKQQFYLDRGLPVEVLDANQVKEAEPELRDGLAGGLLNKSDSVIYPPSATNFLLRHPLISLKRGLVTAIREGSTDLEDGDSVHAPIIINACGIHAPNLTPELPIAIRPRKGHLLITDRYPGFLRHQIVELGYLKSAHSTTSDSVAFNVQPRTTGQILIGSSRQYGAQNAEVDAGIVNRMLRRAIEFMPKIAGLSALREWTGFRAATPDKLPVVGRCPGYQNLFVAAGHEGLGITTSLGTARLILDQILKRPPSIDLLPFSPERVIGAHA